MYNVGALIPRSTAFSLSAAVERFRREGLRSELTRSGDGGHGFRVYYGAWAIDCWYDEGPSVRAHNEALAEGPFQPLPAPADVVASCDRLLELWSDPDEDFEHTDDWISFVDELIRAFPGVMVFDSVEGEWWT
jgi:hypothetical protein